MAHDQNLTFLHTSMLKQLIILSNNNFFEETKFATIPYNSLTLTLHLYGVSPVCCRICVTMLHFLIKPLPQY